MPTRKLFFLMLLSAVGAVAATPDFLLGVDYSQWLPSNVWQLANDNLGSIYMLTSGGFFNDTPPSTVTKLSPDGKSIVWQNHLTFPAGSMAVDPNGGVYVTQLDASGAESVVKLGPGGAGIAWTEPVGLTLHAGFFSTIAADSSGRVYLAAAAAGDTQILRVNAAGNAIDYRSLFGGTPSSVAVDASGAAFVTGYFGTPDSFLAKYSPDGSQAFFSIWSAPDRSGSVPPSVALDASGSPVVFSDSMIKRFDAAGSVTSSKRIVTLRRSSGFALDASGNAYVVGSTESNLAYPVKNSLAACGTDLLVVAAPDGTILQSTYIPGMKYLAGPLLVNRDSSVLLRTAPATGGTPTRTGPFDAGSGGELVQLAQNTNAQPVSLACAANGASYNYGTVSPGEMFILYGSKLGPTEGVEFHATVDLPYPTRLANTEVTFDGKQAPLIYTQDGQINLIAPSSLTPGANTEVCVAYQGVKAGCMTIPVQATDPAVFTVDGTYAIAYNADGSQNSATNPAAANSLVSIFATGLGPISPSQPDGAILGSSLPSNVLSIGVTGQRPAQFIVFANVAADVTFAGPALYHPGGVSQITFRVMPNIGTNVTPYSVKLPSTESPEFFIYVAAQ